MLETVFYLLKTFMVGWHNFTAALGNTSLGFWIQVIGLPIVTFIVTIVVVGLMEGREGLMKHINKTLLVAVGIALAADVVIYGPILGWKFISAIYQDHVALSSQLAIAQHNLSQKDSQDIAAFLPVKQGLEGQISNLRVDCARFEGENQSLNRETRAQQLLIGGCQEQAIKLLTPEAQKTTPVLLEPFNPSTVDQNIKLILLTNKPVTPVWLDIICDQPVKSGNVTILGSGILGGGTDKVGSRQLSVKISTPAWTPISPMLATVSYVGSRAIACSFVER